jgi:hypothetical protein
MLSLSILLVLGLCPLLAASPDYTITYSLTGPLGPNLNNGPDCLGLNTFAATASAMVSSTAVPTSTTTNSATYTLPAGAVTAAAGTLSFTNTTPWTMKYKLTAKGDSLTLSGVGPLSAVVTANSALVVGSFPKTVLGKTGHPSPLAKAHQPQPLSSPGSYLSYTVPPPLSCALTKLGFTGSAGSVPAAPPFGK